MLNRPSTAVNNWAVVRVGAVLAMIAMLVISSPAPNGIFAHPHDPSEDDSHHIHYAENSTNEVRDFDSTDPEEARIEWNVRGVDAADFEISSAGVLTFKESPDYENPTDRAHGALDRNGDGNTDDPGEAAEITTSDNAYQITVSATEVWDGANTSLPAKRTDIHLRVTVENVDDPGELTLQWLQPEVGTRIRATLTDPDGNISVSTWTWSTSKVGGIPDVNEESHWNAVIGEGLATVLTPADENTVSSYVPQGDTVASDIDSAVDEGDHLRVKVDYTDVHGVGRTRYGISMNPVRAEVSSPGDNGSPDFGEETDTRKVPESTAVGDPVGAPVAAIDPDNDTLTYELVEVATPNDGDDEFFDIDMATGQITVAQGLDYDMIGGRTDGAKTGVYIVTVRATDPSGLADDITVTITAENVNEDPVVTGRAELSVAEGITGAAYVGLPDAPGIDATPDEPTNRQNEYLYEEPDQLDSIARWTLEGDDAGVFDHSGRFEPRYLQFKVPPDYENPTDKNRDNVYEVTLVATDTDPLGTGAGIGKINVWLTVTNVEEAGKVVFTEGEAAYPDEMLVAEVQDPDDHGGDMGRPYQGVHIVSWQWSRALTDVTGTVFAAIVGATTNRYTAEDSDRGYYLRATATYTDPLSDPDDPDTGDRDERISEEGVTPSLRTEMATTENAVSIPFGPKSAPTFDETGTVARKVAENTGPGGNVGAPVVAMGPGAPVYSLVGSDAQYFNIDNTGQITVGGDAGEGEGGTDPELDYEKKKMFSVTVKVEVMDGEANQNAEVDVNIIVTDVDELPVITDADGGKVDQTPYYAEIDEAGAPNTAAVATYVGDDPEGGTISWDLRGADAALFTIDGGVLQFKAAPDYEDPKDVADANTATPSAEATDNTYNVVIRVIASRASDDTGPAGTVDTLVTIFVTDVDEDGEVVISWLQPEAEIPITASLSDPDGPQDADLPVTETAITEVAWVWTVSEVVQGSLDVDNDAHWGVAPGAGNTTESYTPDTTDVNKYLRVTASYRDRSGEAEIDMMAREMSANPVQAARDGADNGSPDFVDEKVDRGVAETAAVGANVGAPVTASVDSPNLKDTLTYGLRAFDDAGTADRSTGVDAPSNADADVAAFDIDKASGQITVAQKLDYESRGDPDDGIYVVVVTVTDPSNLKDSIVVVITAEDRNEDPVLSGRPELTIFEINSGEANAVNPEFEGNTASGAPTVNVYGVVDEDHRSATDQWALKGEDAGQFQLIGTVGRTLVFRNQPDYENPADVDGDNVYKVTVVTFDGDGGSGEFDVCIAVMNINEAGKVTLLDEEDVALVQPHALGPITADLTDPDEGVTGVTWQWARSQVNPPTTLNALEVIVGATSAAYTPTNEDRSYFLKVTATYMDAKNDTTTDTVPRMADVTAMHAVLEVLDLKRPPEFPEETAMRMVAENAPSTTFVGDHLPLPMDPDDPERVGLTYTLEGEDTEFFELLSTDSGPDGDAYNDDDVYSTQIRVKLHDQAHDLNHEAEGRNGKYEVVLKVTDDSDLEDTITVTITVMDRNEAPSTPIEASGEAPTPDANNAPEFPAAETGMRSVAENTATGMPIGAPVAAMDDDAGDTLTYTLGGADMASFDIEDTTGQLMTKAALDFETKASYTVEVTASDGNTAADATIAVTITVTDVSLSTDDAVNAYDVNENEVIDGDEVLNAVDDYFDDPPQLTGDQILDIVDLYFDQF